MSNAKFISCFAAAIFSLHACCKGASQTGGADSGPASAQPGSTGVEEPSVIGKEEESSIIMFMNANCAFLEWCLGKYKFTKVTCPSESKCRVSFTTRDPKDDTTVDGDVEVTGFKTIMATDEPFPSESFGGAMGKSITAWRKAKWPQEAQAAAAGGYKLDPEIARDAIDTLNDVEKEGPLKEGYTLKFTKLTCEKKNKCRLSFTAAQKAKGKPAEYSVDVTGFGEVMDDDGSFEEAVVDAIVDWSTAK